MTRVPAPPSTGVRRVRATRAPGSVPRLLAGLLLLVCTGARADLDSALAALDRRDTAAALPLLSDAAAAGDARAAATLAELHERGQGVLRDHEAALRWRTVAAKLGDAESAYRVGMVHARGEGVPRDDALAKTYLRRAAVRGHGQAMVELAKLLGAADASDAEVRESALWYERALSRGEVKAPRLAPPPQPAPPDAALTELREQYRARWRDALLGRSPWRAVPPAPSVVWRDPVAEPLFVPGVTGTPLLPPGGGWIWLDPRGVLPHLPPPR